MDDSAPWKTKETIVGLPRLLVLSDLVAVTLSQAIGAGMDDSAPWKTKETIVGLPRLLVLSDLVAVTFSPLEPLLHLRTPSRTQASGSPVSPGNAECGTGNGEFGMRNAEWGRKDGR